MGDSSHSSRFKLIVPYLYFFPLKLGMIILGAFVDLGGSASGSLSLISLYKSVSYGGGETGCLTSSKSMSSSEICGGGTSKLGGMGGIAIGY